jgi:hypothetical protein
MRAWLSALASRGDVPRVIVPAALADRDLVDAPRAYDGRIALAFPIDPTDPSSEDASAYRALVELSRSSGRYRPGQLAAIAVVDLLVESLKGAGRDLDRDRLVAALERVREFRTGLVPPLTFGPNRRVGALGAYAVAVDLSSHRFVPTGRWLETERPLPGR